jgi:branched-chain amino acid transport system permease protein
MLTRIVLMYRGFKEDILAIPTRAIFFFGAILLLIVPIFNQDPYILTLLIYTAIFAIFAASWDMLGGYTGVVSLAHGVLFGIAAYTAALLNIHLNLPPVITIPLGAVVAVLTGLLIAIPSLRVRGMYFTLISVAIPYIVTGIIFALPDLTGGELGISGVGALADTKLESYYIVYPIMIICCLIMWKVTDSRSAIIRLGIKLQAIREDEIAARSVGVNTVKQKLIAFAISGFFAGIAGGLYAHVIHVAGPSTMELMFAFNPLIWTTFGGTGTIIGPILGTYILYPFMEVLRAFPEVRMLIFALLLIVILYFMPEGLLNWFRDKAEEICPRCKLVNISLRRTCRACGANLHLEREHEHK